MLVLPRTLIFCCHYLKSCVSVVKMNIHLQVRFVILFFFQIAGIDGQSRDILINVVYYFHSSPAIDSLIYPTVSVRLLWPFNSLWTSDVIWRQGSRSTLAQVMACCLTAPSHYLNQCWLMISEVLWHSPDSNFTGKYLRYFSWKWVWNLLIWDCSQIPQGTMS